MQVQQFASSTAMEVLIVAVGAVNSARDVTFTQNVHNLNEGVISNHHVPGTDSTNRRMMVAAGSTGGPLLDAMTGSHETESAKFIAAIGKYATAVHIKALTLVRHDLNDLNAADHCTTVAVALLNCSKLAYQSLRHASQLPQRH